MLTATIVQSLYIHVLHTIAYKKQTNAHTHTQKHRNPVQSNMLLLIAFAVEAVELSVCLTTNFDECKVNELCFTTGQKIVVCCLPKAPPMKLIMGQICIMTHGYKNGIFIEFCNENFNTITSQSSDLVPRDAIQEVFSQCIDLLNGLNKNYSLSLMPIDQLFKGKPLHISASNITQLFGRVELCLNTSDFKWIHGVVERMREFWKLCEFANAALVFLEVRDALNLTGDFQLVDNVAYQVGQLYMHVYIMYSCNSMSYTM